MHFWKGAVKVRVGAAAPPAGGHGVVPYTGAVLALVLADTVVVAVRVVDVLDGGDVVLDRGGVVLGGEVAPPSSSPERPTSTSANTTPTTARRTSEAMAAVSARRAAGGGGVGGGNGVATGRW
jgi:hypothetical protein